MSAAALQCAPPRARAGARVFELSRQLTLWRGTKKAVGGTKSKAEEGEGERLYGDETVIISLN